MKYKSILLKPYARSTANSLEVKAKNALKDQQRLFEDHIRSAKNTEFGKEHHFGSIHSFRDYQKKVPLRKYEDYRKYIDLILAGEKDVLWPGLPRYMATTSGTTSGSKYIPLTKASANTHIAAARTALFNYSHKWDNPHIWDGKMIFLSGSPELHKQTPIPSGRLSGIVNHMVPSWLKSNQLPSFKTNGISDWEAKIDAIVEESVEEDLRLISGIPPWLIMYFEKLLEKTNKSTIKEVFPNFSLLIHGGVNYTSYESKIRNLIGDDIDTLETYPASEGFIAFQHHRHSGLLLNTFGGIVYEFVPSQDLDSDRPDRIALKDVEIGVDYAVVLTTNAGLWSYVLGDTVEFVATDPYLIEVTGRTQHFISAFGEHVIQKEVEQAISLTSEAFNECVQEFTVAPQVHSAPGSLPHHEWYIEFDRPPANIDTFSTYLDEQLCVQNSYYDDLIRGRVIQPLRIYPIPKGSFRKYMKDIGKLGGQNKVPHLTNDRGIADFLTGLMGRGK